MESDARQQEITDTINFLDGLDPNLVSAIYPTLGYQLVTESQEHSLEKDSQKTISIGNNTPINVSQYVGLLIQNNPQILVEYPILSIEYNSDGSIKEGIEIDDTVLREKFEAITRNGRGLLSISELVSCYNASNKGMIDDLFSQLTSAMSSKPDVVRRETLGNTDYVQ